MQFKLWLEAKLDPNLFKLNKYEGGGGKKYLSNNLSLKIDKSGNVVELSKEDYNLNLPYISVEPGAKNISCQRLSPQSTEFKKIITALKSRYPDIINWPVQVFGQSGHMQTGNKKYERNAGYWLQNSISLTNKMPKYFYHGTSTNLWYDGIKNKGLLPRAISGNAGSYGAQNVDSLSKHNLVYLSTHPDAAAREAAKQAANKYGGKPLILKIDSSGLFPDKLHADEDARVASAHQSVERMSVVAYEGKVPPSSIFPFLTGTRYVEKNRNYHKWEKFQNVPMEDHPLTNKLKSGDIPYSGDPEYYALLDAGIIAKKETTTPSGHRNTNIEKIKDISNEELKKILKDAYWTQNARAILHDLNKGYQGHIYQLKDIEATDKILNDKIVQMLMDSQLVSLDRNRLYLNTWEPESRAIKMAKLMGKMPFQELAKHISELVKT